MRQRYGLLTLFVCAAANAGPGGAVAAPVELVIPSFDETVPACRVRVRVNTEMCADKSCLIPVHKRLSTEPVELHLTCLPSYSPTGFENPPAEARIRAIRNRSTKGAVSLIENAALPSLGPHQELNFCLYGEKTNICGYAKVAGLPGKESPAVARIISLIMRIEWSAPSKH